MAANTTDFLGSDARLQIIDASGITSTVKLFNELDLFGIPLKAIIEGGFIAPIIRPFSPGIARTRYKKYSALKPLNRIRNYLDEITFCLLLLIIIDNTT